MKLTKSQAGALGGRVSSIKKQAAARQNGAKGGRPKRTDSTSCVKSKKS